VHVTKERETGRLFRGGRSSWRARAGVSPPDHQQVIAWISSLFRIALAAAGALFTIALAQAALAE